MLEYKHVILFYLSIFAIIAIVAFLIYKRIIFSKKEKDSGLNLLRQMDNWAMPFFNGSRYLNFRLMKIIRSNLSVHYDKIKNRRKDKSFTKYDLVFNIFENP